MKTLPRPRNKKSLRLWLIAIALGVVAIGVFVLLDPIQKVGQGEFPQEVVLKSARPIDRVSYCSCALDEATRRKAETDADPMLFLWKETLGPKRDRFTARIECWSAVGFFSTSAGHMPHLIILAAFADGTRACRVVDVPEGHGKEPVVVDFR